MKKLTLALICLTLLLSACGTETREPEETDLLETTAAVTSVTVVNTSVDTEVSEEKLLKNLEEPDDDTVYPWLDLSEFAEESYKAEEVVPTGGDSIIVRYESQNKYDVEDRFNSSEYADYICCIDLRERKQLSRINAPVNESYFDLGNYNENGRKLVCAVLVTVDEDYSVKSKALIIFSPDGNYSITENVGDIDFEYIVNETEMSNYLGEIINEPIINENEYISYAVPENGEYISQYKKIFVERSDGQHRLLSSDFSLLSTETGEIIKKYPFGTDIMLCNDPFFTDSYICFFDYETKIISSVKRP